MKGQLFPVQVTPIVVPPYSVVLSEYSNAFREQLILNLLLSDVSANRDVHLKFSLTSNTGFAAQSAPVVVGATPYRLSGGIPLRLTNADLQAYFQLQNLVGVSSQQFASPLPDGVYNFCFEVIDDRSGQVISRNTCAQAFIRQNDPPFLNYPKKGKSVEETNPTNIVFNWTPRHLNATNVEYEFTLTELWDEGIDPQTAFFTSPPLYQSTTKATTLLYGPTEPALLPNKNYGWRVRAVVNDGISQTSTFKNNGFSEIWHFRHKGICRAPQFGLTVPKTATSQIIRWQFGDYTAYKVQYRKVGGSSNAWFEERATSFEEAVTIYNLEKNTTYEYRIGGQCRRGEDFVYGNSQQFTTVSNSEEAGGYQCGALPDITITNQEPLERLGVNETFFAGDFPVTAKFVEQVGVGRYTGVGYVTVPYLADMRILVKFENIGINTDKQLTNGIVETTYDPEWKGVDDISDEIEAVVNLVGNILETLETLETLESVADSIREGELTGAGIETVVGKIKDNLPVKELEDLNDLQDELSTLEEELENADTKEKEEKVKEKINEVNQEIADVIDGVQENMSDLIMKAIEKYYRQNKSKEVSLSNAYNAIYNIKSSNLETIDSVDGSFEFEGEIEVVEIPKEFIKTFDIQERYHLYFFSKAIAENKDKKETIKNFVTKSLETEIDLIKVMKASQDKGDSESQTIDLLVESAGKVFKGLIQKYRYNYIEQ